MRKLTSKTSLNPWSQSPHWGSPLKCPHRTYFTDLTVLDDIPTQIIDIFRLPAFMREGQMMANMIICIKFRGPLPDRIALNSAVYRIRFHTLPVLRCTCCLLFGHGNASCNSKNRCGRCSCYHDAKDYSRPESCFFCGGNYCPIYRQCLAYLQAL